MPIAPSFEVNMREFLAALQDFQGHSKRDFAVNLQINARGILRNALAITPPNRIEDRSAVVVNSDGSSSNATASFAVGGRDAQRDGEAAITSDLLRIFLPASPGFMKKFLHANPDGTRAAAAQGKAKKGTVVKVLTQAELRDYHKSRKGANGRVRGWSICAAARCS